MSIQQGRRIYKKGEVIIQEGDYSFDWFVLFHGKVGVFRGANLISQFHERGTIFGEMSGILARPRTATMKAMEDSEVMVIQSSVDEVIRNHPEIAHKILINLAERLAKTTDELWAVIENHEKK